MSEHAEVEEQVDKLVIELEELRDNPPHARSRGSVMGPPPSNEVKRHKASIARVKQDIKKLLKPLKKKGQGTPVSLVVEANPNVPEHVFAAPEAGEVEKLSLKVVGPIPDDGNGKPAESVVVTLIESNADGTRRVSTDHVISTVRASDEFPAFIVEPGETYHIVSSLSISLQVSFMFRSL